MAEVTKIVDTIRTSDNLDIVAKNLRNEATLPNVSDISLTGERSDQLIGSAANLQYRQSVIPGGPSIPSLASPLSYDPSQNFFWSPFIDGSVPLPNYTETDQIDYSAGLSQLGNRGELYQYGSANNNSVNGLYYDLSQDFSRSPVIDGSIPLASDTEVDQMYYSAGLPQPGDQWQQYQDGFPNDSSVRD